MLSLLLTGFVLITIVSYIHTKRAAEELAMGHAVQALRFLNLELDNQFQELRRNLVQWSKEDIFSLALADTYLGRSARAAANTRLADRIRDRDIARIMLANATGDIIAASDPGIIGVISIADRGFFQRSLTGETVVESLSKGRYVEYPITIISTMVAPKEMDKPGVLYLVLDTSRFAQRLLDELRVGQSGGAVVLDPQTGIIITPSWATPGQFNPGPHLAALDAIANTGEVLRYRTGAAGMETERMAVAGRNAHTGWLLVVEADAHEILAPAAWLATINGLISLCILVLAAFSLAALNQALGGLRASEARYRSLIETSPLGIATFDGHGRATYLNERAKRILGLETAASLPEDWRLELEDESGTLLPPETLPMARALAEAAPMHGWTAWHRRPDGQRRVLSLNAAPLMVSGQGSDVVAVMEDVTDLYNARQVLQHSKKELETLVEQRTLELTEANRRLLELDELKSAFLSTVSHDLRTPLTSVLGFAKLIHREFAKRFAPQATDPRLAKSATTILANLDIIVQEGERLTRLITDLLDFSRLDSGYYHWKDGPVDLAALARDAARALAAAFGENKGVRLRLDIPEQLPPMQLDPDRIMQVLINLLSNALKFTAQGEVLLFVREIHDTGQTVVQLGVTDTGAGIAAGEIGRIFDRFYQVGQAGGSMETNKPLGAGLGLAICKQIVEHYHGRIRVQSEPGRGSTFVVELPREHSQALPA
ncbi:cache domain-containing sensor histidine kinase [Megalodesulfovibrio gigas]|nr:ATP-binding protein [Megalodesulfovibrio gigas]